jgi:hypothetical protein
MNGMDKYSQVFGFRSSRVREPYPSPYLHGSNKLQKLKIICLHKGLLSLKKHYVPYVIS